jgi:tetratricopeptide (TPR) repeat protein
VVYDAWAREIAAGDWLGHQVFYQAPLYPYFLGALYAGLSDDPLLVRGLQCTLGALACALLASAGASVFSRGAGIAAGLLLATYAPSIFLEAQLQKSVLDLLFVCLSLWLVARLMRAPRRRLAAALGLALGALVLARENALVLAGVLGSWLLVLPGVARPRRVALALAFAGGLAAALLPVAARNWWVGGELHLTTSQLGPNLYIGNHPGAAGGYEPLRPGRGSAEFERQDATELAEQALGHPVTPREVSAYWTRRAVDFAVSQPAEWLRLMVRKLVLLVSAVELVDSEDQYTTAEFSAVLRESGRLGHFGVLAPLALLGVFVTWPRRRELWWLYALGATYAASVVLFYVFARYRYPLVPYLALLAGAGLVGARGWVRTRSWPQIAASAASVLALAALSNGVSGMSKASMGAVTHVNLANFFKQRGELERAVHHYREALALAPQLEEAPHNLADTLLDLGRPREAIQSYQRNLQQNANDPVGHYNLARLLRAEGESRQALEHLRRAVALDPDHADARGDLGELEVETAARLARRGDDAAALEHYRGALAVLPDAPPALWGAAWILATGPDTALRRPEEALELALRALAGSARLTPPNLETLAAAYAANGRFDEATERAREAAALYAAAGRPSPRLAEALARYERREPFVR